MYHHNSAAVLPSFLLMLLGSIDCLTTVIGVLYYGAVELNHFLTGIVHTNIPAFLALKLSATVSIGFTCFLAKKTLNKASDRTSKSYKYSSWLMKAAYTGLTVFLILVVVNNLTIFLS
jgi:hypothetical protein